MDSGTAGIAQACNIEDVSIVYVYLFVNCSVKLHA